MDQHNGKELEWIRADLLVHDPRYQRKLYPAQVNRIAKEFDADLFGVITVSERADGRWYVIDGQHRVAALRQMGWGDQNVPCIVHRGLWLEGEAKVFAETQARRRQLKPTEVFAAQLIAGHPVAMEIRDTVEGVGYQLNLVHGEIDGGRIVSVSALQYIYDNYRRPTLLRDVLTLTRDAWGMGPGPKAPVLKGVARFLSLFGTTYDRRRLVLVLQRLQQERLISEAQDHRRVTANNADESFARTLLREYNKDLRSNRLPDYEPAIAAARIRRGLEVQPLGTQARRAKPREQSAHVTD